MSSYLERLRQRELTDKSLQGELLPATGKVQKLQDWAEENKEKYGTVLEHDSATSRGKENLEVSETKQETPKTELYLNPETQDLEVSEPELNSQSLDLLYRFCKGGMK